MIAMTLGDTLATHLEFRPRNYLLEHPIKDIQGGGTWGLAIGQLTHSFFCQTIRFVSIIISSVELVNSLRIYEFCFEFSN